MAANPRYCKYNCDYMCSMCLEAERDAERKNHVPKIPAPWNPLATDDDLAAPGWMGYHGRPDLQVDEYGELTGFPLTKYDPVGPINPPTGSSGHYVPPPPRVLKEKQVILLEQEVPAVSPPLLITGEIIT